MKERYFFIELLLTWILLFITVYIFKDLPQYYKTIVLFLITSGFIFNQFYLKKLSYLPKIINIIALGVLFWVFYSLYKSSFVYRDILLIYIKGVLILEILLSFCASEKKYLNYLQVFSISLIMLSPFLSKIFSIGYYLLFISYFIIWFAVFKIKFYSCFISDKKNYYIKYNSTALAGILLLLSMVISLVLFFKFPPEEIKKAGFLSEENKTIEVDPDALEKEYYDLQDKVQKIATGTVTNFRSTEENQKTLYMLSQLIKDSPYTMEVESAKEGLISLLKTPGPGLEEAVGEGFTILLKDYVSKKSQVNINRANEKIIENLRNTTFNIKDKIITIVLLNDFKNSNLRKQIQKNINSLNQHINNANLNDSAKDVFRELISKVRDWKIFQVYDEQMNTLENNINNYSDETEKVEFSNLTSSIKNAQDNSELSLIRNQIEKLKVSMPDQANADINKMKEVCDLKSELLLPKELERAKEEVNDSELPLNKIEELNKILDEIKYSPDQEKLLDLQNKLEESSLGLNQELRELSDNVADNVNVIINIDKMEEQITKTDLKEKKEKIPSFNIGWLSKSILFLIIILILTVIVAFPILFLIVQNKKHELCSLCENPREFIIQLYNNLMDILLVSGLNPAVPLPPISLAVILEKEYFIENGSFLKLTLKYEEARYSSHTLHAIDVSEALVNYNSFLTKLISKFCKLKIFFLYLRTLINTQPFFIKSILKKGGVDEF